MTEEQEKEIYVVPLQKRHKSGKIRYLIELSTGVGTMETKKKILNENGERQF